MSRLFETRSEDFSSEPREMYVSALMEHVTKEVLGELRPPRSEDEMKLLALGMERAKERSRIISYKPHMKQALFHEVPSQLRMFCGSNQSGKTTALIAELISWCLGFRPWSGERIIRPNGELVTGPIRAMIGAEDYVNSHAEVIIPKIREMIPFEAIVPSTERLQGRVFHKLHFHNGSTLKHMSYEMDPSKWEGHTWDVVGFDEPPPRHAYVGVKRGCMRNSAPILFAFTPLKEPWLFDEIYQHPDTVHGSTWSDIERAKGKSQFAVTIDLCENPYLPEDQKVIFEESLDEEEKEARIHGRFMHLMGRIYKTFDRAKHVISDFEPRPGDPIGMVVDPHDRKPFAMVWFTVTARNEMVIFHEWPPYDFYESGGCELGIEDYVGIIDHIETDILGGVDVAWRIMDPNFGKSPSVSSGMTLQDEFVAKGLYFDVSVSDNIRNGHMAVKTALKESRLFIDERCANMVRGILNYTWDDHKRKQEHGVKEKPRDKYKDFPDCMRYMVVWGPEWFEQEAAPIIDMTAHRRMGLG